MRILYILKKICIHPIPPTLHTYILSIYEPATTIVNWWNCKILLYIIKIAMTKTGKGLKYILVMMLVQQGFFSDYITPARRQPPLTSDYLYEEKRQRRPILRLDTSSTSSSFFILDKRRKGQCSSGVGFVCRASSVLLSRSAEAAGTHRADTKFHLKNLFWGVCFMFNHIPHNNKLNSLHDRENIEEKYIDSLN